MKPLYGFMQDRKWYEDCLHILQGHVPMWGWLHEHWQWPPGGIDHIGQTHTDWHLPEPSCNVELGTCLELLPLDRVADHYRDALGHAIGNALLALELSGTLLWALLR